MARKKNKPTNIYVLASVVAIALGGLVVAMLTHHPSYAKAGQGRVNDRSRICMLQATLQPRSGLTYVYNGKKYYLCCGDCLAGFRKDAATYSHATDPVDGKPADKAGAPAYAYHGHAYFFSSAATMTEFASDPAKYDTNMPSQAAKRGRLFVVAIGGHRALRRRVRFHLRLGGSELANFQM